MPIHTIGLHSDPMRSYIAFFKHMDGNAAQFCHAMSGAVQRSTIAEQKYVRNPIVTNIAVKEAIPIGFRTAVHGGLTRPVDSISTVEVDPVDRVPTLSQFLPQEPEKRSRRAL